MTSFQVIQGYGNSKKVLKGIPKFIVIENPNEPLAWFNPYIGQTFEVLDISPYQYVKVCYNKELDAYGWLPLSCCRPHLETVKE